MLSMMRNEETTMSETAPSSPLESALAAMAQPVLRYLERYVGDPVLAADLQQETLTRMARGYGTFAGRSSVKTWAFAIANRVAADHFRAAENRVRIVELDEADDIAAPEPGVDAALIAQEMNNCVRQVIDSLPEIHRAALILHDLEGLSLEQTALICDCSLGAVKVRLHRARGRLREALTRACAFYHDEDGAYRCDRKA